MLRFPELERADVGTRFFQPCDDLRLVCHGGIKGQAEHLAEVGGGGAADAMDFPDLFLKLERTRLAAGAFEPEAEFFQRHRDSARVFRRHFPEFAFAEARRIVFNLQPAVHRIRADAEDTLVLGEFMDLLAQDVGFFAFLFHLPRA